jgi:hypothetical protein
VVGVGHVLGRRIDDVKSVPAAIEHQRSSPSGVLRIGSERFDVEKVRRRGDDQVVRAIFFHQICDLLAVRAKTRVLAFRRGEQSRAGNQFGRLSRGRATRRARLAAVAPRDRQRQHRK